MSGRVRSVAGHEEVPIAVWQACATPAGAVDGPAALDAARPRFVEASGPTTAAAALRAAGEWSLDGPARRFDGEDWWFRARLPAVDAADELVLAFDGLATVADVWLDGAPLLQSENMFLAHERRIERGGGELVIRCRALDPLLGKKRPRPRWRAPMVENQQLRWYRTTLLGRTPGWSPPAAPVGPWRPVRLERRFGFAVEEVRLAARLEGHLGVVDAACTLRALGGAPPGPVDLVLERDGVTHRAALAGDGARFQGRIELREPERWWPHTHGAPTCFEARLEVGGRAVALGPIGFRTLERDGDFSLAVNGVPLFCRGACWTPPDPVSLAADRDAHARALEQMRSAGMNLVRVGGTMVYESDDFYDQCDRLGVLLWQDLMFANLDYPEDDAAFVAGAVEEARQQLARLQARPSLAVVCGGSEVEQQAAMWGAARERWSPRLFHQVLADVARERCPGVTYWPSSAHGGAFPHEPRTGTTSYYGVGAYLRPLDDARRAEVRFATECLAFANLGDARGLPGGPSVKVHHPAWKARTPRDLGAGWDFDDVRDHYVQRLYGVDPVALRFSDHDRYLELGRVVTGEVMAQVFGEWRRARSTCRGGLVWFLRDLWPGAGWGVVDAGGVPKAAWYHLKRALQPIAAHLSDEGLNGLALHLYNDGAEPLRAEVELALFRAGEVPVASAKRSVEVAPRRAAEHACADWFDGLYDLSYAYRFGPPSHDLVVATVRGTGGEVRAQAFHFPLGLPSARELDVGLSAEARADGQLIVRTRRFAQSIAVDVEGFQPDDAFFHLPPGGERTLQLVRTAGEGALRGTLKPLNAEAVTRIVVA